MSRKGAPFNCTYEGCSASFGRSDRLKIHFRTHTGERPFVCEYENCDKSYVSTSALKRHEATHEGTYRCTIEGCFEILKTKATLQKHIDYFHHHKKHKLYKCNECFKEFAKHNWLQRHMYRHTGIFPIKCPIEDCGKGFLMPSKLRVHMKTHEGHSCKIPGCEKVFSKWSLYVQHLKEFHPAVHKCEVCEREFSTSSNLKTHREIHKLSGRKVFTCEMPKCPRFYFSEKNLQFHIKSYHETRPYLCDKENCHRAFKTKKELNQHLMRHVRRKPRKKKKQRPSFSAILSGCADPRKFTYKMSRKQIASDTSDEFTTDDEVLYQETTSEEEKTTEKSHSELNGSDDKESENKAGPSTRRDSGFCKILPYRRDELYSTDIDSSCEESSKVTGAFPRADIDHRTTLTETGQHSGEFLFGKVPPHDQVQPESGDMDSSYEEPSSKNPSAVFTTHKDPTQILTKTHQLNPIPVMKPPKKRMRLENCASFDENDIQGISMSAGHGDDSIASAQSRTGSKGIDKDASSSEYETITVALFGNVGGKSCYSGSDDVSSCLSEAEDLLSCDDMCSSRER